MRAEAQSVLEFRDEVAISPAAVLLCASAFSLGIDEDRDPVSAPTSATALQQ